MSGGLVIVLIIVVWLFVLAPLLLRGQKPIRRAGEGLEETRIVHEGGTELPTPTRRRPRITAEEARRRLEGSKDSYSDRDKEFEVVQAEDVLVEDSETTFGQKVSNMFRRGRVTGNSEDNDSAEPIAEDVEGDIVHELEAAPEKDETPKTEETSESDTHNEEEVKDEEDHYTDDETYITAGDFLYSETEDEVDQLSAVSDSGEPDYSGDEDFDSEDSLTAEELEFAASRRGRGGWDPEADREHTLSRYQRRQRTLLGLGGVLVIALAIGFIAGHSAWAAPAVVAAVLAVYLVALRQQVRQEQALRRRRIRQLRRARLGVRHRDDEELAIPRQLRRPGAIVVERDDESPDFVDLQSAHLPSEDDAAPEYHGRYSRRTGSYRQVAS